MSGEKNKLQGECYGESFYIDADSWKFCVPDLDIRSDSYTAMQEAIERKKKTKEPVERKRLHIAACMRVDRGNKSGVVVDVVLKGVHAGHGKFIFEGKIDTWKPTVYPRVAWIKMALAEATALRQRASHIDDVVNMFGVEQHGYGFDSSRHAEEVARIEQEFEKKSKEAEKTSLEEQLKNHPYKEIGI